jgi:hypothetical protein
VDQSGPSIARRLAARESEGQYLAFQIIRDFGKPGEGGFACHAMAPLTGRRRKIFDDVGGDDRFEFQLSAFKVSVFHGGL